MNSTTWKIKTKTIFTIFSTNKQTTTTTPATIKYELFKMSATTESTNSNQNKEEFRIERLTDLEKIKELFHGWAAREGWCPGATDLELYYQIDPNGFFVGKIGSTEKIVSIVSAVAYGDEYGFMGFYVVDPNFRGKNYGRPLFCAALDYLSSKKQRLIALEAVEAQAHNYVKCGFQTAHYTRRFAITINDLLQSLTTAKATAKARANTKNDEQNQENHENDQNLLQKQQTTTTTTTRTDGSLSQTTNASQVRFVDASTLPLDKIAQYDSEIFGYDRTQFLRKLFELSAVSLVAIQKSSEDKDKANGENDEKLLEKIVGFGSIRLGGENYYRVGPLFANSTVVARDLLFELSSKLKLKLTGGEISNDSEQQSKLLYMDVHVTNSESIELMSETIGAKALFDTGRMYVGTSEHARYQVSKVFVATSLEAG